MKKTINELLVLVKVTRERLNDLKSMRDQVYKKERFYIGDKSEKIVEPQFDVSEVDKKIVQLQQFVLDVEQKIKVSNSITLIDADYNLDELFEPIRHIQSVK